MERDLKAVRQRDEQTFAAVLDRDYPAVLHLATVLHGDRAGEVARDAWVSLLDAGDVDGAPTLRAWVMRRVVEHRVERHDVRDITSDTSAMFEPDGDLWEGHWAADVPPWPEAAGPAVRAAVENQLHRLPPLIAALVVLRDVEGMSGEEVEAIVGLADDEQRVLLHEGRVVMRDAIAVAVEGVAP